MVEVSGVTLLAVFLWAVTGVFIYGFFTSNYEDTRKMWVVLSILMGTIAFILTLIGTGAIEVI